MNIRRKLPAALLCAAGILLFSVAALAHGVSYQRLQADGAKAFQAVYSSGEPVAYGEVVIFGPEDDVVEFQNGRTDKHGVFAFIPDGSGIWNVEVNAGMGHKLSFEMSVTPQDAVVNEQTNTSGKIDSGFSKTLRAILGISILFNIVFLIARIKRKTHTP